ncbi:MAG: alkaline phosphatase family protein [Gammaproteobacteria bacterium]|nr:alkaline phosphatase family protein [Gammaproteobacteria bacterium]
MYKPNYHDNSIVNLMASITSALGRICTDYSPLAILSGEQISPYKNVVLLVIDGLGDNTLSKLSPQGFLSRNRLGRMTSVCPTTTASAITSFVSGKAPLQHGLSGWFTWLRELGTVTAVLPFRARFGGPPLNEQGIDIGPLLGWSSVFNGFDRPVLALQPLAIAHSHFSKASLGQATHIGFVDFDHCLQLASEQLKNSPGFIYAYWSELDRLAHRHGIGSRDVAQHLAELEASIDSFASNLDADTLLLITADHGLLDTDAAHTIELEHHPTLQECLNLPLCGEPRFAFCYLHGDKHEVFRDYIAQHLSQCCELLSRKEMLDMGLFGLGQAHAEFSHRIGDYALVMKENYVIKDLVGAEKAYTQIGVHGGLSEDELYVPLIQITQGQ